MNDIEALNEKFANQRLTKIHIVDNPNGFVFEFENGQAITIMHSHPFSNSNIVLRESIKSHYADKTDAGFQEIIKYID